MFLNGKIYIKFLNISLHIYVSFISMNYKNLYLTSLLYFDLRRGFCSLPKQSCFKLCISYTSRCIAILSCCSLLVCNLSSCLLVYFLLHIAIVYLVSFLLLLLFTFWTWKHGIRKISNLKKSYRNQRKRGYLSLVGFSFDFCFCLFFLLFCRKIKFNEDRWSKYSSGH